MTAPLDVQGSATEAQPEAVLGGVQAKAIEGRSLGQIAWMRLKRDKVAIAGGVVVILLILIAIFAGVISSLAGQDPYAYHSKLIDPNYSTPKGGFGGISWDHLLGVEPVSGRDIFSRILYGARVSMIIAFLATGVSVLIGVGVGVVAGYFGGVVDQLLSRLMDLLLAFPLLLFAIALVYVIGDTSLLGLSDNNTRIFVLVVIIGFFNWPYIGRIIRGQTLSLREKEYIEAARSLGASPTRILFREILPNLIGPILVYSTLIIPTNILFEAALSFLGVGVRPPQASWGAMLSDASQGLFQIDPEYMIVPGAALFITVIAFNLFGDGLRDALDPRSSR
ncbi:MAG: peptide/nickel transport system permease protein [Frankiaceae bacterium]|nr:peptide/nickel transport system permease protein [Frankiaceae bacterium]